MPTVSPGEKSRWTSHSCSARKDRRLTSTTPNPPATTMPARGRSRWCNPEILDRAVRHLLRSGISYHERFGAGHGRDPAADVRSDAPADAAGPEVSALTDKTGFGDHAVVLGASIAGLLATRVLADVFPSVTVVDRDLLPETGADRRGVPQGRHAHALLPSGVRILEELFPGLLADLVTAGVPTVSRPDEMYFRTDGHLLCQRGSFRDEDPAYQPSRPFLEGLIRARVHALPGVRIADGRAVVGPTTTTDGARVTGVRVRSDARSGDQVISADLVVDATGRAGRTTVWLAELGHPAPPEESIPVDVRYVSRHLRLAPDALGPEKLMLISGERARPTGMALLAQEGDRWILSLYGYGGHHPSTEDKGFLEFARTVAPPHAFDAIADAEPLDDLVTHRFPANVRRRYETLRRFPEGLLVLGDAICSFNPVYGQGMSIAAQQAVALRRALAAGPDRLARRFFRAAARPVGTAWQLTTGGDLALLGADRPWPDRLIGAYLDRLLTAAEHDMELTDRFLTVTSLDAAPSSLLAPRAVRRVLATTRRGPELGGRRRRPARLGS